MWPSATSHFLFLWLYANLSNCIQWHFDLIQLMILLEIQIQLRDYRQINIYGCRHCPISLVMYFISTKLSDYNFVEMKYITSEFGQYRGIVIVTYSSLRIKLKWKKIQHLLRDLKCSLVQMNSSHVNLICMRMCHYTANNRKSQPCPPGLSSYGLLLMLNPRSPNHWVPSKTPILTSCSLKDLFLTPCHDYQSAGVIAA